jgi:hypothetical protein
MVRKKIVTLYGPRAQGKKDTIWLIKGLMWYVIFFNLCGGTLGTAATTGLLYQPWMIGDGDCGEIGGMKIRYVCIYIVTVIKHVYLNWLDKLTVQSNPHFSLCCIILISLSFKVSLYCDLQEEYLYKLIGWSSSNFHSPHFSGRKRNDTEHLHSHWSKVTW